MAISPTGNEFFYGLNDWRKIFGFSFIVFKMHLSTIIADVGDKWPVSVSAVNYLHIHVFCVLVVTDMVLCLSSGNYLDLVHGSSLRLFFSTCIWLRPSPETPGPLYHLRPRHNVTNAGCGCHWIKPCPTVPNNANFDTPGNCYTSNWGGATRKPYYGPGGWTGDRKPLLSTK